MSLLMTNAEEEHILIQAAETRYGKVLLHSLSFIDLLYELIEVVNPDSFIFISFFTQVYNSLQLAVFSIIRRHYTQYNLNLRHVLESSLMAAYSMKEKNIEIFGIFLSNGTFESKQLNKSAGKWLEEKYPYYSEKILFFKDIINKNYIHSNLVQTEHNFNFEDMEGQFKSTFFDREDVFLEKHWILNTGNIAMGLIQMFDIINRDYRNFRVRDGFKERYSALAKEHDEIRNEFMNDDRFCKILGP